ncbi:hypothetical protein [Luteococcus sp.]|uniref:hypothetical protein n=1 Tax=Luteococcus sp. TaxID=1969402 RepID=UPI003735F784
MYLRKLAPIALGVLIAGTTTPCFANAEDDTINAPADHTIANLIRNVDNSPTTGTPSSTGNSINTAVGRVRVSINDSTASPTSGGFTKLEGRGTDVFAREISGGTQMISVHKDPTNLTQTYSFVGKGLKINADRTVSVTETTPEGAVIEVATIAAPWAVDRRGSEVATHFRVSGDQLIQSITPTSATQFPVIADPRISTKYGVTTVSFSRSETKKIGAATAACRDIVGPIPKVGGALSASCAVFNVVADQALSRGKCLQVKVIPIPAPASVIPWIGTCYA